MKLLPDALMHLKSMPCISELRHAHVLQMMKT